MAIIDDWDFSPPQCPVCGIPLREHWRGRSCLMESWETVNIGGHEWPVKIDPTMPKDQIKMVTRDQVVRITGLGKPEV